MSFVNARATCALGFGLLTASCTGDDITLGPDSGPPKADATTQDQFVYTNDGGDATGPRILITHDGPSAAELLAFNVATAQINGRLVTPGFAYVEQTRNDFFLLETGQDLVYLLDPVSQWNAKASWSVALDDVNDASLEPYADPVQVVEVAPNKAYVLRFDRDTIAIIDPTQSADAGAPTGTVDLSALQQAADPDGSEEISGAVFDATRNRLYVALGNINLYDVDPQGYFQLCSTTVSTLIAIDTTTDMLVNLGGAGPGGGVVLNGFGPQFGILGGVVLDAVGDRVLVFSFGCNAPTTDGGVGAMSGRLIEAVDLGANTTQTLLAANDQSYPGNFVYIDGAHALVQFGFAPYATTYQWIPTQTTLGEAYQTTPDLFAFDYAGARMLGPQSTLTGDGGLGPTNVISVPVGAYDGGGVTLLGQNPFLQPGGYLGNVVYVP